MLPQRVEARILAALRAGDSVRASEAYRRARHCTFAEAEAALLAIALNAGISSEVPAAENRESLAWRLGRSWRDWRRKVGPRTRDDRR